MANGHMYNLQFIVWEQFKKWLVGNHRKSPEHLLTVVGNSVQIVDLGVVSVDPGVIAHFSG